MITLSAAKKTESDGSARGNLKAAAIERITELAQRGSLEALSLRHLSRDLGVSPGALYKHFADKEALLAAVAREGFNQFAQAMEAVMPFESMAENAVAAQARFEALATAYLGFARRHQGLWRLMFGPLGVAPADPNSDLPNSYDWLVKALAELQQFGLIARSDATAQFFAWSAVHGATELRDARHVTPAEDAARMRAHCALIIQALSVPVTD